MVMVQKIAGHEPARKIGDMRVTGGAGEMADIRLYENGSNQTAIMFGQHYCHDRDGDSALKVNHQKLPPARMAKHMQQNPQMNSKIHQPR